MCCSKLLTSSFDTLRDINKIKCLSFPPFLELLGDDLDKKINGPIYLTCSTETFDNLLKCSKNY